MLNAQFKKKNTNLASFIFFSWRVRWLQLSWVFLNRFKTIALLFTCKYIDVHVHVQHVLMARLKYTKTKYYTKFACMLWKILSITFKEEPKQFIILSLNVLWKKRTVRYNGASSSLYNIVFISYKHLVSTCTCINTFKAVITYDTRM